MSETINIFNPEALDANFINENSGHILEAVLDPIEKIILERVLKLSKFNITETGRVLGINRLTVISKMKKHGIIED